jgi:hypothetical protein
MSSNDFASIFEHAASIVRIRLSNLKGVDNVLAAIKTRLATNDFNPLTNRNLFFEPWIEAQQLRVPSDTAEEVSRELHRLTVLHLWTRLRCPDVGLHEDGTIIETDSPQRLQAVLQSDCPHCGSRHGLTSAIVETLYAPNFQSEVGDVMLFDTRRLADPPRKLVRTGLVQDRQMMRISSIANLSSASVSDVGSSLIAALSTNSKLEDVPSPRQVWKQAWTGPSVVLLTYLVLIAPVSFCAGPAIACVASLVVIIVVFLTLRQQTQALLSSAAVQLKVTQMGFGAAIILFAAGTAGFELSMDDNHSLRIPWWRDTHLKLPIKVEFGKVTPWLIASGLACVICILVFNYYTDRKKGWVK